MDAIVHVVRCFDDDDVIHNMGSVDPVRDIEVITTELVLADLQSCETQLDRNLKKVKGQDKEAAANVELLNRLIPHLNEGKPAATLPSANDDDRARMKGFSCSRRSPCFMRATWTRAVSPNRKNRYVAAVRDYVAKNHDARVCVICAQVEAELCDLSPEEGKEFLESLGVADSGVSQLIRQSYDLLGLASYFTAGEKEAKAWTFKKGMTAPQCAGVIHTDFEKGFIKAEVVSYDDLVAAGSVAAARESGKYRLEGKDYLFKDGDVALFRFAN